MNRVETVVVTGSRHWDDLDMHRLLDLLDPVRIVQGGQTGADTIAHIWAQRRGRISVTYFANKEKHGPYRSFLVRNLAMLDDWPFAVVLGFPKKDSKGTWHTMSNAKQRKMTTINGAKMLEEWRSCIK